jgi:hypothetical protein
MRPLVRALAALGVVLMTSLSTLGRDARAETGCTIAQARPGVVHTGETVLVVATCPGLDTKSTQFYWKVIATDSTGNRTEYRGGSGIGRSSITVSSSRPAHTRS